MAIGLGSSSTIGIGLAIRLDDQFSQASKAVKGHMVNIRKESQALIAAFDRIENLGEGMAGVGSTIIRNLGGAVKTYAKFEDIMNSVKVIAGDQGLTNLDYSKMITQVKTLGEQYGILPDQVALAQLELAKAGKKPTEIMAMTEATMALGAATDTMVAGTNGAAEVLVNIMQAYNANASRANEFAAAITSAANQSTIDVSDFFNSMRYAADIARSLSIPIEDAAASIATLGNAGLKGSIAGTSYANMLRYLSKAMGQFGLKRQQEAMAMLGLGAEDFRDAEGNMKSMAEILKVIRERYFKMSQQQRLDATQGIFGVRGDRAAQPLIQGMMDSGPGGLVRAFEEMSRRINKDIAGNVHLKQANDRLDDLLGDWTKMVSAWERLKIAIGSSLGPVLRPLIVGITQGIKSLTEFFEGPAGKWVVRLSAFGSVWMVVLGKFLAVGARFYRFIFTSSVSLKNTFRAANASIGMMNKSLMSGSAAFLGNITKASQVWVAAMLKARGVMTYTSAATGAMMMMNRTKAGRFAGGVGGTLAKIFGVIGGRGGLRLFVKLSAYMSRLAPTFAKLITTFKIGGKIFSGIFRFLFSWPVVLADIAAKLVFGVGIFEKLWDAIKAMVKWLYQMIPQDMPANEQAITKIGRFGTQLNTGEVINNRGQVTTGAEAFTYKALEAIYGKWIPWVDGENNNTYGKAQKLLEQRRRTQIMKTTTPAQTYNDSERQSIIKNMQNLSKGNSIVNITINPQPGRVTKHTLNVDAERKLQSYAIG